MKKIMIALAMTVGFSATAFAQMSPQQTCAIKLENKTKIQMNALEVTTNLIEQNKRVQLDYNIKNVFATSELKMTQVRSEAELRKQMLQAEINAKISMVQFSSMVNKVDPGPQIQQLNYSLQNQMNNIDQNIKYKTEEIQRNTRVQVEGMQQKLNLEIQKLRSDMQLKQQAIQQQLQEGMKACSAIPTTTTGSTYRTVNGLTQ